MDDRTVFFAVVAYWLKLETAEWLRFCAVFARWSLVAPTITILYIRSPQTPPPLRTLCPLSSQAVQLTGYT